MVSRDDQEHVNPTQSRRRSSELSPGRGSRQRGMPVQHPHHHARLMQDRASALSQGHDGTSLQDRASAVSRRIQERCHDANLKRLKRMSSINGS